MRRGMKGNPLNLLSRISNYDSTPMAASKQRERGERRLKARSARRQEQTLLFLHSFVSFKPDLLGIIAFTLRTKNLLTFVSSMTMSFYHMFRLSCDLRFFELWSSQSYNDVYQQNWKRSKETIWDISPLNSSFLSSFSLISHCSHPLSFLVWLMSLFVRRPFPPHFSDSEMGWLSTGRKKLSLRERVGQQVQVRGQSDGQLMLEQAPPTPLSCGSKTCQS